MGMSSPRLIKQKKSFVLVLIFAGFCRKHYLELLNMALYQTEAEDRAQQAEGIADATLRAKQVAMAPSPLNNIVSLSH